MWEGLFICATRFSDVHDTRHAYDVLDGWAIAALAPCYL